MAKTEKPIGIYALYARIGESEPQNEWILANLCEDGYWRELDGRERLFQHQGETVIKSVCLVDFEKKEDDIDDSFRNGFFAACNLLMADETEDKYNLHNYPEWTLLEIAKDLKKRINEVKHIKKENEE